MLLFLTALSVSVFLPAPLKKSQLQNIVLKVFQTNFGIL